MKTVLITGGSRGIGRAMVELFSREGYSVAFTYKSSKEQAEELALSTGALAIAADSSIDEQIKRAVALTEEKLGPVYCLINNAAISSFDLFCDISLEKWNEMLAVNLTSAFLYSKLVLPSMISRHAGRIINISSVWGICGASCEVHYSTTKAALIGMTKALAKELGPSGITVNAIAPGVIDTDMNASLSEEDISVLKEQTPLMRTGRAEEIAEAALYLASDKASFITGEVLNISGGYVI